MGKKPTAACQRDWHIWRRTDLTLHSLARSAVGKATRADLTRLKRVGRCLLYTPRAVWEFLLQQEESIVLINGLSDADAAGCVGQHTLATWSSTQKVVSLSSAESEYFSMVRFASEANRIGQHDTGAWTRSSSANLDRCCSGTRTGSPKRERRNQTRGDEVLMAATEREKRGAQDREDPRHSQSRRLDDETSGWKTFGNVVRAVEHQNVLMADRVQLQC